MDKDKNNNKNQYVSTMQVKNIGGRDHRSRWVYRNGTLLKVEARRCRLSLQQLEDGKSEQSHSNKNAFIVQNNRSANHSRVQGKKMTRFTPSTVLMLKMQVLYSSNIHVHSLPFYTYRGSHIQGLPLKIIRSLQLLYSTPE